MNSSFTVFLGGRDVEISGPADDPSFRLLIAAAELREVLILNHDAMKAHPAGDSRSADDIARTERVLASVNP